MLLAIAAVVFADQALKVVLPTLGTPYLASNLYHPLLALGITVLALILSLRGSSLSLALIIGGGVSNLIDVALRDYVIDTFVVKNFGFNLADVSILIGFLGILRAYLQARINTNLLREN